MDYIRKIFLDVAHYFENQPCPSPGPRSWVSWTTFSRLSSDAGYWTSPMLLPHELGDFGTKDGGTWGQIFAFNDIAHFIIPRRFYWETYLNDKLVAGISLQDIEKIGKNIDKSPSSNISDYALDFKFY